MSQDTYTLIGLGLAGLLAVWLVFSLVKKMLGILLLIALAVGGYVVWTNPDLQHQLIQGVTRFWSSR